MTSRVDPQPTAGYDVERVKGLIVAQRLFDVKWYCRRYGLTDLPDAEAGLQDFLTVGMQAFRNPNPLFDSLFYASTSMGGEHGGLPPFVHYLLHGMEQGAWPHPLMDTPFIQAQLDEAGLNDQPLSAMLHKCGAYQLNPHPLFSTRFYFATYPEIRDRRIHPVIHYIDHGARESRQPHPLFVPQWLNAVAGREIPADQLLTTYLSDPSLFRISSSPYFDAGYYLGVYPDLAAAETSLLYHYLRHGQHEGRTPNPLLDAGHVKDHYSQQLRFTKMDPLSFFVTNDSGFLSPNPQGRPLIPAAGPPIKDRPGVKGEAGGPKPKPRRRKRILFISHNLKVQGAQTSLFELAQGMKRKLHHAASVMAPDDGPMKARYQSENVAVQKYVLPVAGLEDEGHYNRLLEVFEQQILAIRPDIVHGNTIQSYHALAIAARHGIPTVWNIRESEDPLSHGGQFAPVAGRLLQEAISTVTQFVFVSKSTRALWQDCYPELRTAVIQNGIDYNRLQLPYRMAQRAGARAAFGLGPNDLMLLSVGTWTERKGQRDILPALQKVHRRLWPRLQLHFIGANESPYGLEVLGDIEAAPSALRERVTVHRETVGLAERARVLSAYAAADLFVFTSRVESYPRVVNEAMFAGLPIIATPCFGVVEQLEPGVSASFYQPGDIDGLAQAIQELMVNDERRQVLGAAAKDASLHKVIQYDEMLARYDEIYSNLMM